MSAIIGIDPGKTGWVVAVDSDGIAWSEPLPEAPGALSRLLRDRAGLHCAIERQHPVRGQGLASTWSLAGSYWRAREAAAGAGCRVVIVPAVEWQRAMLHGIQHDGRRDLIRAYVQEAERLWPTVSFRGPRGGLLDGKAAAALLAEYYRRRLDGLLEV